jgi:hypothetical protein
MTNYAKIIELLSEIHEINPNIKFGRVIQLSADYKKGKNNVSINQLSSKELYTGLINFKNKLMESET